jgi:hypothetical protein
MNDEDKRRKDDFQFMVLCHAKGNPAMYELLRDRTLDAGDSPAPKAPWCEVHQHFKWCEHNGGVTGATGYEAPPADAGADDLDTTG